MSNHKASLHQPIPGHDLVRGPVIAGGTVFEEFIDWAEASGSVPPNDLLELQNIADEYEVYSVTQAKEIAKQEALLHFIHLYNKIEILEIQREVRKLADDWDKHWVDTFMSAQEVMERNEGVLPAFRQWSYNQNYPPNYYDLFRGIYSPAEWEALKKKYGPERFED